MSPTSSILHPAQHLPHNHFNVLVADGHALQPVDLLNFVHQVSLQRLLAQHVQNVVRVQRAIHQRIAGAQPLAFLHVDVNAARHRVLLLVAVVRGHVDLALALGDFAEANHAVDLADDGRLARLARLEEFDHARQTAGDVLGARALLGNLGQHVARTHFVAVLNHQVSAARQQIALVRLGVLHHEGRLALFVRRIGNHPAREAGHFVHLFVQRDAFLQVLELHRAADLGENRVGVRIPLGQQLAQLHVLAVLHLAGARRKPPGSAPFRGRARPEWPSNRSGSSPPACRPCSPRSSD